MTNYNPFNPFGMCPSPVQKQPINPSQFQQMIPSLDDNFLVQLVQQARAQGISSQEIEDGLNFIQQMRKPQ